MKYTVKELKELLKDIPDDTEILYERIEDAYFNKHQWKAEYLYDNPTHPGFPNLNDSEKDQYLGAFTAFYVEKDKKLLITAHY